MNVAKYQAVHCIVGNAPANGVVDGNSSASGTRYFNGIGAPTSATLLAGNGRYNATASGFIVNALLVNGGASYAVGDVLTGVVGSGTSSQLVQITVLAVLAGVITDWLVSRVGIYSVYSANPISVTGGSGSGATFTLNFPPPDFYLDMTNPPTPVLYVCTTAGSNSASVWAQISITITGAYFGTWDPTKAYTAGQILRVQSAVVIGGVTATVGTFGCIANVPVSPAGNQIPQFPEPTSGTVYWQLISLGIQAISSCSGSTQTIYIQASNPF